jgi:hypothetical protein
MFLALTGSSGGLSEDLSTFGLAIVSSRTHSTDRGSMLGKRSAIVASVALVTASAAVAQQPANPQPAAPATPVPAVGEMAPDFAIRGATRYGLIREPLKLSDFKGQTVVLAFFVRARTRG